MAAPPGDFPTFFKMIPDVNLISSSINNYVFPWFLNKKIKNSKVLYWFYKVIWMKLTSFSPQCDDDDEINLFLAFLAEPNLT